MEYNTPRQLLRPAIERDRGRVLAASRVLYSRFHAPTKRSWAKIPARHENPPASAGGPCPDSRYSDMGQHVHNREANAGSGFADAFHHAPLFAGNRRDGRFPAGSLAENFRRYLPARYDAGRLSSQWVPLPDTRAARNHPGQVRVHYQSFRVARSCPGLLPFSASPKTPDAGRCTDSHHGARLSDSRYARADVELW